MKRALKKLLSHTRFFLIVFFFQLNTLKSQVIANFVTNGGLEKHDDCTQKGPTIMHAYGWRNIDSSLSMGVQYFNKCLLNVPYGITTQLFQYPYKGDGFCGTTFYCPPPFCSISYNRGYFRNRLKSRLVIGSLYCVKLYYNISNSSSYGISDLGIYFGDDSIDTIKKPNIPLTYLIPQIKNAHGHYATDTLNWVALTGTFVANGNEKHMLIGNFTANNAVDTILINPTKLPNVGTDMCIDHASCIPIDLEAYAGPDKNCIVGDSVFIGREPDVEIDESCVWYKLTTNSTLSNPINTIAGMYVKPVTTTTYVVRQQLWCSGVKWDTVVVYQDFVGLSEFNTDKFGFKYFPNPSSSKLFFEYSEALHLNKISFYNLLNQEILVFDEPKKELDISALPTGIYYLKVESNKGIKTFKLMKE